jgi:hypothetical protein
LVEATGAGALAMNSTAEFFRATGALVPFLLAFLALGVKELGPLIGVVMLLDMLAGVGCYFLWLYKTWALVPEQRRGGTTAGAVVGYHFIPGYNLWWLFASNARIAGGLAETLGKYQTSIWRRSSL